MFFKFKGKNIEIHELDNVADLSDVIDVREVAEFSNQSIEGTKNVPMGVLLSDHEQYMNKDKTYYILCQAGVRSVHAAKELQKLGYDVVNVKGGIGKYHGQFLK